MQVSSKHIIWLVVIITLIFLLAGCFLLSYIFLYNRRKKKHEEEKEVLKRQFEDEIVKTQVEVQEQTLQTIATEIHDNIGQILSLARVTLSTVNVNLSPEKATDKVNSTLELLTLGIKELRHMASILHAENILASGLEQAVENEVQWLSRSEQFNIYFFGSSHSSKLENREKELIAFRIVQELINNIIKHANASIIEISFVRDGPKVIISIVDNGIGFRVDEVMQQRRGLGLYSMYKRAAIIGGTLSLSSELSKGTTAILKFEDENRMQNGQ